MRGLYVHVPFCLKKCHYCNYVIVADAPRAKREAFFEALEREADDALARHGKLSYDTLYLGGGTPSSLDPAEMRRLFEIVLKRFPVSPGAEITCEVNPGEVDDVKLATYRALGVNRISLGAQSFNDALLRDMNRVHNARDIGTTMRTLLRLGFANISMDLILRLPGQTPEDASESLRRAAGSGAGQVVLYDLNVHDGTVYGARARRGQLPVPDEKAHDAMWDEAEKILSNAGFAHYEISSFAKPGFESRHNLIYWHNGEYLGLGPGAFSYLGGCRYQYASSVDRWLEKIARGDRSRDEEENITGEKLQVETLLTGLRLEAGVELGAFPELLAHLAAEVPPLESAGLVERRQGRLRLTPRGRRVPETVFTQLSLGTA